MDILSCDFNDRGTRVIHKDRGWQVRIINWRPSDDKANINYLKRYNKTNQILFLTKGWCLLIYANETDHDLKFSSIMMKPLKAYHIPLGLWHSTVIQKDTRIVAVEDSDTSMDNSDIVYLNTAQLESFRKLII